MTIGERIRQLREVKDLSLRELAKTVGVSAAFMSDVELGRRYPSDKHIGAIAQALGAKLNDLKDYDTRPPIRELRRITLSDPQYGLAFRQLIDRNISSQELLDFIKEQGKRDGGKTED